MHNQGIGSGNEVFSIILPVFNRGALVVEALNSINAQTYRPIELIIVDDGSTDNTKEVIQKWIEEEKEEGITAKYIYQSNSGPSEARNRGIKEISGQYVQFFDSDDVLYPERLSILVDTFRQEKCDFIQTGFDGFNADTGEIIEKHFGRQGDNLIEAALFGHLWANTLRSAFTSSLVRQIEGWRKDMVCFEDREYVERAICNATKAIAIHPILASARRGGSSRVSDIVKTYEGRRCRIMCEEGLANLVFKLHCGSVSYKAKQAFASRIYALGFRSNARGWKDLSERCGKVARLFDVKLDRKGNVRMLVWCAGSYPAKLYRFLAKIKRNK